MKKQKSVLIGLSGGVDSAVAALLLKKQGYEVIGAFMINFSETKNKLTGDCNYLEDKKDAQKIAAILNIPLKILNFENQYKTLIIKPMFKSYADGLTPNPDSSCNKIIKFPLLWKHARKLGCDYIATGHYIKKTKNKDNSFSVKIPKDKNKDQSYFLYGLTQQVLSHTLFPIGEANLTKPEVREIAKLHDLPNHDKRSTRGICFVGKIDMKSFLQQKIKPNSGSVLSVKGDTIGTHQGIMFYTIGERIGPKSGFTIDKSYINKTSKKLYVAKKNIRSNTITIAPQGHKSLKKNKFRIIKLNFISGHAPKFPLVCKVKIRHSASLTSATVQEKDNKLLCTLKKPIQGIAAGQSCVLYKPRTNLILGGGEIRNP